MQDKTGNIQKKMVYTLFIFSLVCIILLLLPVWDITEIHIQNTSYYKEEEILSATGLQEGMHVLSISKSKAISQLNALPYVKSASIEIDFPNAINIVIEENKPIGYVPFNGTYLCLSSEGQVLTQNDKMQMELPLIQGIKFDSYTKGEKLPIQNEDNFIAVKEITNVLSKYEFLDKVNIIDISNMEQIHLYVDKLDVIIGNIREFDKKIMWLIQVHKDYTMGILDLSMIHLGQAILTPLT